MPILNITLITLSRGDARTAYQNNGDIRLHCGPERLKRKSAITTTAQNDIVSE